MQPPKSVAGSFRSQITFSLIQIRVDSKSLLTCQMLDVLPLRLQQQKHAKTPTTTAKQLNRMKVKPKYDNTPHSHPGNSFGEASNMGGLMVGIASLAICEFLTKKGDALVTVSFQVS